MLFKYAVVPLAASLATSVAALPVPGDAVLMRRQGMSAYPSDGSDSADASYAGPATVDPAYSSADLGAAAPAAGSTTSHHNKPHGFFGKIGAIGDVAQKGIDNFKQEMDTIHDDDNYKRDLEADSSAEEPFWKRQGDPTAAGGDLGGMDPSSYPSSYPSMDPSAASMDPGAASMDPSAAPMQDPSAGSTQSSGKKSYHHGFFGTIGKWGDRFQSTIDAGKAALKDVWSSIKASD